MITSSYGEGRIVYANRAAEHVSGYKPEELASLDPFDRMRPDDRPRCRAASKRLVSNPGLSLDLEHRVRHKDGTWRWMGPSRASSITRRSQTIAPGGG